jgi:short subunit dehydrogenase-like uncharacterized protein
MMTGPWLLYGANGYTGELVARLAVAQGHHPILAGRRADAVCSLADELGLHRRLFSLEDPGLVAEGLEGMSLVLHCAGPFSGTSRAMADACLRTRTHYLDVTGEVAVLEALAARGEEAREAGVMLLPGCGFEVVPGDCLAVHLSRRLPGARKIALGFEALGRVSRGTALTTLEALGRGGLVRREGALTPVPPAWRTRAIDFGEGPRKAVTVPWGDLSSAWHSTGIPDIEVYMAAPWSLRLLLRATRRFGTLVTAGWAQRILRRHLLAGPRGPSREERQRGRAWAWGEAEDEQGRRVASRLRTPEAYSFSARASLAAVARVLAGEAPAGFQTPATAFDPDFVLGIEGVSRHDGAEGAAEPRPPARG